MLVVTSDGPTTGCDAGGGGGHGGAGHEHGGGATNGDTSGPQTTVDYGSAPWRRTVILIEKRTSPGQDLFIRGGIGHEHRPGNRNLSHPAFTYAFKH